MKLVIGITGEKGSGKGTFIEQLKKCAPHASIERIASSELLSDVLDLWDIEKTRRNLQDVAIVMDNHFGKGTVTHAVWKRISQSTSDIVIFDGVRWQTDVDMIRSFPQNLLIYITSSVKVRYERTKNRKEKVGEDITSFEKFLEEEQVGTEVEIPIIGKSADVIIQNNGSFVDYKKEIERVYKDKIVSFIN